ncbi:hypothetical protein [Rheinheimera sp.]|uniref:hypothetical protein n=1 Tax=Rheinheimera sp. TaxID=1869214 RepID=UPI0023540B5B|nr:hypothetical protein [Rheinheimera sp.]
MFKRNSLLIPKPDSEIVIISEVMVVVETFVERGDVFLLPYVTAGANATKFPNRKPLKYKISEIEQQLAEGLIEIGTIQLESFKNQPEESLCDKDGKAYPSTVERDRRFTIVKKSLELGDELFYPTHGSGLFAKVASDLGTTQSNAQRYLNLFFRGGRNKNALIPHRGRHSSASKCGGRKVGRKRATFKEYGINGKAIQERDKDYIRRIGKKYYLSKSGKSIAKCFQLCLQEYYYLNRSILPDGTYHYEYKPPNEIISKWQFRDWLPIVLGMSRQQIQAVRRGHSQHKTKFAGRTGDAAPNALGPGHVWQLDSTPVDIELVAPYDRRVLIKRVTLYVVRDAYTRSICGIHIGVGSASWAEARLALFHAIREKVGYALECGLHISKDDWVESGAPSFLLVDNEEFQNKISESVTAHMNINVLYARAYEGDDKGLVESSFHMIHAMMRNEEIPGFRYKGLMGRNRNIPMKTACLTPYDLKKILIIYAIKHNCITWKENYPIEQQALFDGVKPVCRDYWRWGERNRGYFLSQPNERELYLNLLEVGELTVHQTHLHLKGHAINYCCDFISKSGFQDKPTLKGKIHKTLKCRYIRGDMSRILIEFDGQLRIGKLHSDHRRFVNMSLDEIKDAKAHWDGLKQVHEYDVLASKSKYSQQKQMVVSAARLAKDEDIKELGISNKRDSRQEATSVLAKQADAIELKRLDQAVLDVVSVEATEALFAEHKAESLVLDDLNNDDEEDEYISLLEEMLNNER